MKKWIIAFLVLLGIIAGVVYYFYDRLSYLPYWYAKDQPAGQYRLPAEVDALEAKIIRDLNNGKQVEIPALEVVALLADQLEKKLGYEVRKAIKAAKVSTHSGGIDLEMIVDVRRMPVEDLPAEWQKALDQLLKVVPQNALNDLYVKCYLQIEKQDDFVSFDPLSRVSLGKMNLPLSDMKKKLASKGKIPLKKFPVSGFEFKENSIILNPKSGR